MGRGGGMVKSTMYVGTEWNGMSHNGTGVDWGSVEQDDMEWDNMVSIRKERA